MKLLKVWDNGSIRKIQTVNKHNNNDDDVGEVCYLTVVLLIAEIVWYQ
jgi:hypothetical protein